MTDAPLLSVVIPTFNNADVLATCLAAWERHAGEQADDVHELRSTNRGFCEARAPFVEACAIRTACC
jgi:hypothetical protein